jgi:hypothetical protein
MAAPQVFAGHGHGQILDKGMELGRPGLDGGSENSALRQKGPIPRFGRLENLAMVSVPGGVVFAAASSRTPSSFTLVRRQLPGEVDPGRFPPFPRVPGVADKGGHPGQGNVLDVGRGQQTRDAGVLSGLVAAADR